MATLRAGAHATDSIHWHSRFHGTRRGASQVCLWASARVFRAQIELSAIAGVRADDAMQTAECGFEYDPVLRMYCTEPSSSEVQTCLRFSSEDLIAALGSGLGGRVHLCG